MKAAVSALAANSWSLPTARHALYPKKARGVAEIDKNIRVEPGAAHYLSQSTQMGSGRLAAAVALQKRIRPAPCRLSTVDPFYGDCDILTPFGIRFSKHHKR